MSCWPWWKLAGLVIGAIWVTGALLVLVVRWLLRAIRQIFVGPWA